jgi:hypothetical protein
MMGSCEVEEVRGKEMKGKAVDVNGQMMHTDSTVEGYNERGYKRPTYHVDSLQSLAGRNSFFHVVLRCCQYISLRKELHIFMREDHQRASKDAADISERFSHAQNSICAVGSLSLSPASLGNNLTKHHCEARKDGTPF